MKNILPVTGRTDESALPPSQDITGAVAAAPNGRHG
jgi:hypothetical protein